MHSQLDLLLMIFVALIIMDCFKTIQRNGLSRTWINPYLANVLILYPHNTRKSKTLITGHLVILAWASVLKSVFKYKHCSLSDSNGIRTHNHLVCKRTFNRLAKLAEWLSCVVSSYLYGDLYGEFVGIYLYGAFPLLSVGLLWNSYVTW